MMILQNSNVDSKVLLKPGRAVIRSSYLFICCTELSFTCVEHVASPDKFRCIWFFKMWHKAQPVEHEVEEISKSTLNSEPGAWTIIMKIKCQKSEHATQVIYLLGALYSAAT